MDQGILVALLLLLAQQLEGNVLVPRIMGSSVGVHPLWVLFATLAATALYGGEPAGLRGYAGGEG